MKHEYSFVVLFLLTLCITPSLQGKYIITSNVLSKDCHYTKLLDFRELIFKMSILIFQGIQCYFELPVGAPATIQNCPDSSSGCYKVATCNFLRFFIDI